MPDNINTEAQYNDSIDRYVFGYKIGGTYVEAPVMMTLDEYLAHIGKKQRADFFKTKN